METIFIRRKKAKKSAKRHTQSRVAVKRTPTPLQKEQSSGEIQTQLLEEDQHVHIPPESASALPFQTDDADHAETPLNAYKDIVILLDVFARNINKTRTTLRIYDPYYCDGSVIEKLGSLGFKNVINRCMDSWVV